MRAPLSFFFYQIFAVAVCCVPFASMGKSPPVKSTAIRKIEAAHKGESLTGRSISTVNAYELTVDGYTIVVLAGGEFFGNDDSQGIAQIRLDPRLNSEDTIKPTPIKAGPIQFVAERNRILTFISIKAPYVFTYDLLEGKFAPAVDSSIPRRLRGDLNDDQLIDLTDIAILKAYIDREAHPTQPKDARDFNDDGKIDASDLRILKSICVYPNCKPRQ